MSFPLQHARTRRFTLGTPRDVIVDPGGERVFFLRSREGTDPVLCLWMLDVESEEEALIVDPAELAIDDATLPAAERARRERARESAGGIVSFALSPDTERACFALGGVLHLTNIAERRTISLPTGPAVFDPRFSPTGRHIAYVSGDELRVVEPDVANSDRALSPNNPTAESTSSISLFWGRAEFIAAEEMQRSRGYWWSPDGASLLATCVDESPVAQWWIGDPAHPSRQPSSIRYPAAGTANANVELVQLGIDGSASKIDWSGDDYEYLADVVWDEGKPPLAVRQTRDQRTVDIAEIDLDIGKVRSRHVISDDTWVELQPTAPRWFGRQLLTIEDVTQLDRRTICVDGLPLDLGQCNVRSIVGELDGRLVFSGSSEPTEVHLYALTPQSDAGLSPAATVEQLTSVPGVHGATVGGNTMVIRSNVPETHGVTVAVHNSTATIADRSELPEITARPHFRGDGDELRAVVFFPADHDGATKLPVLLDPYGGPHAQRVLKAQGPHLVSQWFANQGFAVVVTDGRGTPGRGPAFERAVWGDLAQPVLDDQIAALDRIANEFGFLDLDRVGIRGWSFGGYLAALAVLRRPDRFHAAIAGAPVTRWELYDTHYTERYLGTPAAYPEHYRQTDLINEASSLSRPLLLIHGLADDNVVAAHTLQLSTALLAAGRDHAVLPLSGVTHMTPQENVAENLLILQHAFLEQALSQPQQQSDKRCTEHSG